MVSDDNNDVLGHAMAATPLIGLEGDASGHALIEIRPDDLVPYVSALQSRWLATEPDTTHRVVDGTLVFSDISGFTPLSERLARQGKVGAEQLTDILNEVFDRLLGAANSLGGDLLSFGGDALLLLFDGPGHQLRAAAAARALREALRPYHRMRHEAGLISLGMSMGAASGPVHLVMVGRSHRQLLVLGPTVTRTLCLETAADAGEVLIDDALAAALPARLLGASRDGGTLLRPGGPLSVSDVPDLRDGPIGHPELAVPIALRTLLAARLGGGEHRQAVLTFLRFGGRLDERLSSPDPTETAAAVAGLDALVTAAQAACEANDVTFLAADVDKDAGKLLFVAGVPRAADDDEDRMLSAMRSLLEADQPLTLQIGVHRGRSFAVDVGGRHRRTYAVMGDATNLAARVMGKALLGTVVATEAVVARTQREVQLERLEPFMVKGKSQPIQASIVGPMGTGRRRQQGAHASALVGRVTERAVLAGTLAPTTTPAPVVSLTGDVGLGKSRLVLDLLEHAGEGARILRVEASAFATAIPYGALVPPIRRLLGLGDVGEVNGTALAQALAGIDEGLVPYAPLVGLVVGLDLPDTDVTGRLDPAFRRSRTAAVLTQLLQRSTPAPALLLVEDAHWLDDASAELLAFALDELRHIGWSTVLTRRPQGTPVQLPAGSTQLELGPLEQAEAVELVEALDTDEALGPDVVREVVRRSAGNPLFLRELVDAALAGRSVDDLPATVEATIAARIDILDPIARDLLRIASVLGPRFPASLLGRVADLGPGLSGSVQELSDFLGVEQDTVRFHLDLVREVAYEGLPYRRRRALHGRAADLIAASLADPLERAETLASHYATAQRWPESWSWSRIAAGRARRAAATNEAIGFLDNALVAGRAIGASTAELAEVAEQLGDVAELGGRYGRATAAYQEARQHHRDEPLALARLSRKEGQLRERQGRYTSALRWYAKGFSQLDAIDHPRDREVLRAELLNQIGVARLRQGRLRAAVAPLQDAAALAARMGEVTVLARSFSFLDWALTDLGDPDCARYRTLALPMYQMMGDELGQANSLNNLGVAAYYAGEWEQALDYYARFRSACERAGDMVQQATAANNIAEILSDQGFTADAEQLLRSARALWRSYHYAVGIALAESNLGRVAARSGRLDEAVQRYTTARAGFAAIGAENFVIETDARLAERHVLAHDPEAALAAAAPVEAALRREKIPVVRAFIGRVVGCARAQLGDVEGAVAALQASLDDGRLVDAPYEVALTAAALADVLAASGRRPDAVALHREAEQQFERLGVKHPPLLPVTAA